jgi:hypothetical protein
VNNREFDSDIDRTLRVGGRRFVAPEGRGEFLRPTYGSDADGDTSPPKVPRTVALKLLVMAIVMLGLLAAVMVIFT